MTRYEGWFLLPFVAIYILIIGARGKRDGRAALVFCVIAGAAPALWLAHNRWYFGDPLYFYRGPYSALAIQGKTHLSGQRRLARRGAIFLRSGQTGRGMAGAGDRRRRDRCCVISRGA